jgi:glycosyltransferase involved in cell wall biosynthesis
MRIACITSSLIPSSTANSIQVMKVCDAMQQSGHEVCVWAPGTREYEFDRMQMLYGLTSTFDVKWLPSVKRLKRYDYVISTMNAALHWKPDVIYTWMSQAAVAALVMRLPVILEMHELAHGRFGLFWLRRFLNSNERKQLVVVSRALQTALEEQVGFPIPEKDVVIAPNGVDLTRYTSLPTASDARKQLGLEEKITLGYTGHFYAGRGVDTLFCLAKSYPDVQHLWIGGREEELAVVRIRLVTTGLKNVVLTGFMDNTRLPLYQSACDILVMPYEKAISGSSGGNSAEFCSPMKMFEYMAAGRAIISSDLPVIHEVLDHTDALFCPPEDKDSWVKAVGLLIRDAKKRDQLGRTAKNAIQNFSIIARQQKILQFMKNTG